ncbi:MAG: PrgI family protein, partial [Oscillospiraceae bacterium]|nr:PrgI family protein [Oscillospiraceae bacterium]
MEVKVNKEIRNYTESMFFGLNLRQCIFSLLAVGAAVGIFFGFKDSLGTETVSWICILGAFPFGAMGFITYHSMTAEQFAWAWIKSEVIMPKHLIFYPANLYYEAVRLLLDGKGNKRKTKSICRKEKKAIDDNNSVR